MKAEERKELESNILAAKLGTFVQTAKKGPSKKSFLWVALGIAVVIGLVCWNLYRSSVRRTESERWTQFLLRDGRMATGTDQHNYFKLFVAQNSIAGSYSSLALTNPASQGSVEKKKNSFDELKAAESYFKDLQTSLKSDPTTLAQSLYSIGLINETKSLYEPERIEEFLENARSNYAKLVEKHGDTAYAKLGKARLEILNDETKTKELIAELKGIVPSRPLPGRDSGAFDAESFMRDFQMMTPEQKKQALERIPGHGGP